ncbi:chlorohydrolase family protein, putative [Talaromyces stipitatus ATCC 10500]|uniref:Chlorohydrolase family protein, putative n=1 Tax=Talaromyces stipitatus (strain ATCC 10500 / CBS 375.48 / QM 6759 / NRRL 1006) TaxID=441959 RepID=B8MT76_TALSN|nr:chlorohydrolase family protein, putative [Talaromyces stipitatus ATCC 10500]EED12173.1 chlorohydrolase family protein, putative [Talaromyces stipitatus ATCC 10500]
MELLCCMVYCQVGSTGVHVDANARLVVTVNPTLICYPSLKTYKLKYKQQAAGSDLSQIFIYLSASMRKIPYRCYETELPMVSKVLRGGTVLTFDDATQRVRVLRRASVVMQDDRIIAITPDTETEVPADADVVNVDGKIVCPGFVNTHVHMWQSVYRTIGPNIVLSHYFSWLSQASETARVAFTPHDIYISSLQGYLEGLYSGVTSYVDHAHHNWAPDFVEPGFRAAGDSGARVLWCYDVADHDNFPLKEQWEVLGRIAASTISSSLVQPGISLDSLLSSFNRETNNQLQHTREKISKLNLRGITMHHLGGPWPTGNSSPAQICQLNLHSDQCPIIFSHAPFLTNQEQDALRKNNFFVSITPESEFHFGHGQISGRLISDQAALGLDTNWTFSGDLLSQARLWLQTVRQMNFHRALEKGLLPKETPFTVEQGFLMATRQGGLAMKRPDIGVLQVGAKADIVIFNGDSPNMLGWSDPIAAVLLHANPGDIEHVLVDGEFRKRDFKLVNLKSEWSQVRDQFLEAAQRIQKVAEKPPPLPKKLWGVGEMGDVEVASTMLPSRNHH